MRDWPEPARKDTLNFHQRKYNLSKIKWHEPLSSWASLLCITPPKRYYHLRFFNLPGLQNREGIVSQTNLAE
jgi:hypothetical protein